MKNLEFSKLINQAKSASTSKVIQKVVSVKNKQNNEIQFSFYIEKELLKKVKLKALENEVSIKSIINDALNSHLEKGK